MWIALYDYAAVESNELSISTGDRVRVVRKDPSGWWECSRNDKTGWVPSNYVSESAFS